MLNIMWSQFLPCSKNYGLLWKILKPENLDDTKLKATNNMRLIFKVYTHKNVQETLNFGTSW